MNDPAALDALFDDPAPDALDLRFPPADPAGRTEAAIMGTMLNLNEFRARNEDRAPREWSGLCGSPAQTDECGQSDCSKTDFSESHR